jgi:hypothetical protein
MLITADGGSSDRSRVRLAKAQFQVDRRRRRVQTVTTILPN